MRSLDLPRFYRYAAGMVVKIEQQVADLVDPARHGAIGDSGAVLAGTPPVIVTDEPGVPYDLRLTIEALHGKVICTAAVVTQREGGPPIMRSALARLPIDRLLRQAAIAVGFDPTADSILGGLSGDMADRVERSMAPARGRRGDPEARQRLLATVATMYRDLTAAGVSNPKPAIARQLGYSPSYVGSLIGQARRTKPPLLGPAYSGRAGEAARGRRRSAQRKGEQ